MDGQTLKGTELISIIRGKKIPPPTPTSSLMLIVRKNFDVKTIVLNLSCLNLAIFPGLNISHQRTRLEFVYDLGFRCYQDVAQHLSSLPSLCPFPRHAAATRALRAWRYSGLHSMSGVTSENSIFLSVFASETVLA